MTRLLTRRHLLSVLDPAECLAALEEGFRTADTGPSAAGLRIRTELPFPGTATALLPGVLPGAAVYTVKVNAKFPGAAPALRGVVCLHSGRDGELLAVLDAATLTAWRTGLAAALGTHLLAAPDGAAGGFGVVGVVGAGAQAELVLRGLDAVRGRSGLVVHDTDRGRAAAFAARHGGRRGGRVVESARAVAAEADVVVLATWSRTPLLTAADIRPGQHLTSLGADEPGKCELAADLLRRARVVVDDRELAAAAGALGAVGLPAGTAAATLGEIVRGVRPGRTAADDITVYAPVGLPWQDLALALPAYERARDLGIGLSVDFLS
ncbi:ornithine cyclodeaminase family protein [Streptomyces sp. NPDC006798]|uniref:ornithine cyclodeaminase family protein n=1 Tax=Streptomyces sp. NPDC006798 TaxID=3155462 RepID=UPI0033EAE640